MTYDDEIEDYSLPEYIVLDVVVDKSPIYKSGIIREAIAKYGEWIDHGPYIYGEYSDDIDEAVGSLLSQGAIRHIANGPRIIITDYGRHLLSMFIDGGPYEDDDWEGVRMKVVGQ